MKEKFNKIMKHKKELVLGIIVGFILVGALVFSVISLVTDSSNENKGNNEIKEENNDDNNEENNDNNVDYGTSDEASIIRVYGMSMNDAITLVKGSFGSDNFEFECEISQDVTYIVTATNTITKDTYKYEVDPKTKMFYWIG